MMIFGIMVFLTGIIIAVVAPIGKKKNDRCSASVQGVLKSKKEGDASANTYFYTYIVNGTEYELRSSICSKEADNIGDRCTIWYDPAKPKIAQPFRYNSNKMFTILFIAGIVLILLGIILIFLGFISRYRLIQ